MNIELSPKQCEYINNATHRWNFKIGATQCGKTHIDVAFIIPSRILERKNKKGLNLILGVTKETIERNVLEPMRDIWGDKLVGEINSRNSCRIFGEKVYCLGAEKVSQVAKLRGAKFKYVYIDEIVDINEGVFNLLKSRLSLAYSLCDATGNPSHPEHHIKTFIDSESDVYCQDWTLYDNPFLHPRVIKDMETDYRGTVFFDRYILGKWALAEGIIYREFADNPEAKDRDGNQRWLIENNGSKPVFISIGCDVGGNGSRTTFIATGFHGNVHSKYNSITVLDEEVIIKDNVDIKAMYEAFDAIYNRVTNEYGQIIKWLFIDSEATMIINSLRAYARSKGYPVKVDICQKGRIFDRIMLIVSLLAGDRIKILRKCRGVIKSLKNQRWNDNKADTREDNGHDVNIDIADGLEYSINTFAEQLIRRY